MAAESRSGPRRAGFSPRRALLVSVAFPVVAWFFASRFGLMVGIGAVVVWWVANRPRVVCWAVSVACLAAAPLALFLQGLPSSSVVGADFSVRHWAANDLVVAALIFGAFAALIELLGMDVHRTSSGWVRRLGRRLGERARGEPREVPFYPPSGRSIDQQPD